MVWLADIFIQFRTQPGRALAFEIACLVPALALLAVAGFGWGGYFWLQDRVQAAADRALAAAVAEPDPGRRPGLARAAAQRVLGAPPADLELLTDRKGRPTVRIVYDARSQRQDWGRLAPMPPAVIVRLASRP